MTYAFEDMPLPDALGLLEFRGRDHSFRASEVASMAEALAARTLAVAALQEELPDAYGFRVLQASLPRPADWRRKATALSLSVRAVAEGAPISNYVETESVATFPDVDLSQVGESLSRRIAAPALMPAIPKPERKISYPVVIDTDRSFVWDDGPNGGSYRFNQKPGPSKRIRNANLVLLTRDVAMPFPSLVEEFAPLLEDTQSEYSGMVHELNAMADRTRFVERTRRGFLPMIDPAAVFVDIREM